MSRYADKLFWIVMAIIVLVITFLSYVTFFYQTTPVQSTIDENGLALKKKEPKKVRDLDHPPKPVEEVKKSEPKQEPEKPEQKTPPPPPAVKKAEPAKAPFPPMPSEYPPATAESMDTLVDGLFERVNQRTQMQFGQALFEEHTMLDSGMRLEARATSVWKIIPQNYKAQILQILTNQYTLIACNIAKIVNCTPNNTPSISIIDSSGHEIAYQNSSGSQILE